MGPGSFFFRLGLVGLISYLGWEVTRRDRGRFSAVRQLGQTSLLIYWMHVEICYGFATRPLQKRLSFGGATLAFLVLLAAMLALSMVKTRYAPVLKQWLRTRRDRMSRPSSRPSPLPGGAVTATPPPGGLLLELWAELGPRLDGGRLVEAAVAGPDRSWTQPSPPWRCWRWARWPARCWPAWPGRTRGHPIAGDRPPRLVNHATVARRQCRQRRIR